MQKRIPIVLFLCILIFSCEKDSIIAGRDNNLAMGNPSDARTNENNFLMEKTQFALSYNRSRGTANWVAWHLSMAWKGDATRAENFRSDDSLPESWYKVKTSDYVGSGFDRGHLCPSADRDRSETDNEATYLMTNIVPQSPNSNRDTWVALETYCRKLASVGNELYIVAGVLGQGGSGSNGGTTKTLEGKVVVPESLWKVIVILPLGDNDIDRVNSETRVVAIKIPNRQSIKSNWGEYRLSVDALEDLTGYDFLSNVSNSIQKQLESRVDNGETN
ncbi:DNA/RNA non-specific endonuclease [Emticicia sp. BO119]|uniref:DNA/RNA non-specific endonuclease n=1 Tax=Emticicia sp. BO119 TaxID=2757768 RepID=UPI0015F01AC7|nr:DNA/RNA non-specific endonuclease [Emticicia sp. BO119]MBA4851515.1 DNA/RNA non-specific endonuclease [Emticicia sp. BO119]